MSASKLSDAQKSLIYASRSKPDVLKSLAAGLVVWLVTLSLAVGFAAFAFHSVPQLITEGIAMQLLGSAIVYIVSGLGSQAKEVFWQASPLPSLYYGQFVKYASQNCDGDLTSTIQIFIMVCTITFGIALVLCAKCQAGKILEYFPDTVLTGYIGGIGTLILRSAITLLSGVDPLEDMEAFSQTNSLIHVAVGCSLGIVMFFVLRRFAHPVTMVLPIFITVALFHIAIMTMGVSLQTTRDSGWVFQNYGSFPFQQLYTDLNFSSVDSSLLAQPGLPLIAQMTLLSIVAQYSSSGAVLAEFTGSTSGVDHVTHTVGVGNALVGGCSGMALAGGMAPSAVSAAIVGPGNANRWVHITCGCLHLALFLSGYPLVSFIPKFALAGCLLIPIGMKMMWGALLSSFWSFGLGDYACIVSVTITTIAWDVQTALGVGFVLNSLVLLVNYAQQDIVFERSSLREFRSMKERSANDRKAIEALGGVARVWRLHGVLFLSNTVSLKRELTGLLNDDDEGKFLILDLARVTYVERSVWAIFFQLADKALERKHGMANFMFCGLSDEVKVQLAQCGALACKLRLVRSLALALEIAEDSILQEQGCAVSKGMEGEKQDVYLKLSKALAAVKAGSTKSWSSDQLASFFTDSQYSAGDPVCEEGHKADDLYYVASGEFHLYKKSSTPTSTAQLLLMRKMTYGCLFGSEKLLGIPNYKASVSCKVSGALIRLPMKAFEEMQSSEPQLALDLALLVASKRSELCWELLEHAFTPDKVLSETSEAQKRKSNGIIRRFTQAVDEQQSLKQLAVQQSLLSRITAFFTRMAHASPVCVEEIHTPVSQDLPAKMTATTQEITKSRSLRRYSLTEY